MSEGSAGEAACRSHELGLGDDDRNLGRTQVRASLILCGAARRAADAPALAAEVEPRGGDTNKRTRTERTDPIAVGGPPQLRDIDAWSIG